MEDIGFNADTTWMKFADCLVEMGIIADYIENAKEPVRDNAGAGPANVQDTPPASRFAEAR